MNLEEDKLKQESTDLLANRLVEWDKEIIKYQEILNTLEVDRFELEKKLLETKQNIKLARFALSKLQAQKRIVDRYYWMKAKP